MLVRARTSTAGSGLEVFNEALAYYGRLPGFHPGRPPRNKGQRYPADPPKVEEIVAVMQATGTAPTEEAPRPDRRVVASRAAHPGSG
jgi:hypothetical protein